MIHRILTCKNHPDLRWSCKDIAWTENADGTGYYNGQRNIFFDGCSIGAKMYSDGSGLACKREVDGQIIEECTCSVHDLIIAPEDKLVKRD